MALVLAPIALAVAGGGYAYGCYQLTRAIDARTRTLLGGNPSPQTAGDHTGVFLGVFGVAYFLGARTLRPAFGRLQRPEVVQSASQFLQSVAPGLLRHGIACTGGVSAAAAATAAYDVQQARGSSSDGRSH